MGYSIDRTGEATAGPFPLGMNNKSKEQDLPEGAARNIVNCDLSSSGKVSRRKGCTKVYSGLGTKGGYSCPVGTYFIEGINLCKFNGDDSASILFSGVYGETFAFDYFNGVVYFSDGLITKKIINDTVIPWGLAKPSAPALSEVSGSLDPGVYLAALSWVDERGQESGASSFVSFKLTEKAGIKFNSLPGLIQGASALRIYLSLPNGNSLYHLTDTINSDFTIMAGSYDSGSTLGLLNISGPPAGNIIKHYNGRMYISSGKVVWYSEPYSFDHFRLSESFLQFPLEITVMEPVSDGIFFASNIETNFYSGNPEDGFTAIPKFNYGGLIGTSRKIPNTDDVMWMSQRGVIIGSPSGVCLNKQDHNVATESGTSGTTLIREQDGLQQIIASVNNPTTSALAATSFIEAEIIRRT